ncbi:hypothetical protein KNU71_gp129 [Streptomyces phage Braelyn]|uniref:Uncharacterized protein n=1 Tax=Streptomyces phage Braelyn TaxID=2593356 RepID=A0A514U206_9CAUD|nr:hypothetical protein KNU71_gp129 [Streptomyces phage Braelyn]QDK02988.1 hypothetical protein SEA_BRAELYN_155 [Streptomyces phage Braelyn]
MSDATEAESKAEEEISHSLDDGRPIKEIVKDAAKAYAVAKGRQAFFAAVKLMKAKEKEKGGEKKNTKGVKAMQKKASQLRVGDITSKGEVLTVGKSPVDRKQFEIVFMGPSGSDRQVVDQNTKYEVVERRSIR